jgi:adenine deaminase
LIPCSLDLRLRLIRVAQSLEAPDLLVRGGSVWNAFTGEVLPGDVAICEDRIAWAGPGSWNGPIAETTSLADAGGRIIVPGYIEPHTHPWPFANPLSVGEAAVCRGTTCLVYDDLLLHLAMGSERLKLLTRAVSEAALPLVYWVARMASQSRFEGEEEFFSPRRVEELLLGPEVLATGELTRWTDLTDERWSGRLLAIIERARTLGKFADGHTAGASRKRLPALAATGLRSCHEAIDAQEAVDRLRQGFWVLLRNSSLRPDLLALLPALQESAFSERFVYTTDGAKAHHLSDVGFTDHLIRTALESGVPPRVAYRPATLNAATLLGLDEDLGAVAPGRVANLNLLEDLANPTPEVVVCRGRVVAREGRLVVAAPSDSFDWNRFYGGAEPPIPTWPAELFLIPGDAPNPFPCGSLANAVITREQPIVLGARGSGLWPTGEDKLVLALTDRTGRWMTRGVISGFSTKLEGLATTYTTNAGILILGKTPEAMAQALSGLKEVGGGMVTLTTGGERKDFPLPLAGISLRGRFEGAAEAARHFQQTMVAAGYPHADANYSLLFFSCDFLPELRATQAGWIRTKTGEVLLASQQLC